MLTKVQVAESEEDLDRALKWLSFLPQALLRKARQGGKSGRDNIACRFNCLTRGDWGRLAGLWEVYMKRADEDEQVRSVFYRRHSGEEIKRKKAVKFISEGQISKAAN